MQTIAATWQIPEIGSVSQEPVPEWIMQPWLQNKLSFNGFGGLNMDSEAFGLGSAGPELVVVAYPGDDVLLMADNTIRFRPSVDTP
jgi:hypothetical protein